MPRSVHFRNLGLLGAGQSHECCFLCWGSVALVHQLSALPMAVSSEADPSPALTEYFADLDDPRRENSTDYPLHEIIVLTICGVICGADGFTSIANFGEAKKEWLGQFLELENGIPSHDTIGRFFGLLDPEAFEARFSRWAR